MKRCRRHLVPYHRRRRKPRRLVRSSQGQDPAGDGEGRRARHRQEHRRRGDDIKVYRDETRSEAVATFHFLRQQMAKREGRANLCLSDFVAPKEKQIPDYIGGFAVTAGLNIEAKLSDFKSNHDDYSDILLKALADRFAEAFAERMHERVRQEFWGYAPKERLDNADLIAEQYRGIRPAPGYPACPDHSEKRISSNLWKPRRERVSNSQTGSQCSRPQASRGFISRTPRRTISVSVGLAGIRSKIMPPGAKSQWRRRNVGFPQTSATAVHELGGLLEGTLSDRTSFEDAPVERDRDTTLPSIQPSHFRILAMGTNIGRGARRRKLTHLRPSQHAVPDKPTKITAFHFPTLRLFPNS